MLLFAPTTNTLVLKLSAAQPHGVFQSEILQFAMRWRTSVLEKTWRRVCNKSHCWFLTGKGWSLQNTGTYLSLSCLNSNHLGNLWLPKVCVSPVSAGERLGNVVPCSSLLSYLGAKYIRTLKKDWSKSQMNVLEALNVDPEALKLVKHVCVQKSYWF